MKIKRQQLTVLFLSIFVFTLGFSMVIPIIPFFAKSFGGSIIDVGFLMAAFSLMELLFAPIWGKLSDKIGRKPVLILGLSGFGVSYVIGGLTTHLWMLYLSQVMAGILVAGLYPAATAYVADLTKPHERGRLMGILGAASGLGMIIGPALASIFAIFGMNIPFFAAAAIAFVTLIIGIVWLPESKSNQVNHIKESQLTFKQALSSSILSELAIFFFLMAFVSFVLGSIEGTFGYFIMDKFGLGQNPAEMPILLTGIFLTGPNVMGIVFSFVGITSVITQALLVGRVIEKIGEEKTIILGLLILTAGVLLFVFTIELISLILASIVIAVALGLIMPSISTAVSNKTSDENQGVMMGFLGSFNSTGRVLGPLLGVFAYSITMALPYVASSFIALISAVILWLRVEKETTENTLTNKEI